MHLYVDSKECPVQINHNQLTPSSFPRAVNSQLDSSSALASGIDFNRPELGYRSPDQLRVIARSQTPLAMADLDDAAADLHGPPTCPSFPPRGTPRASRRGGC